jgi:hypothetical protein
MMRIRINGADADIQLETEQTVGDVLAGIEQWLAASDPRQGGGHRLSGLAIDGETAHTGSLAAFCGRDVNSVGTLDIVTSSLPELIAESLLAVLDDTATYEALGFEDAQRYAGQWKESPQARLLAEQIPELFDWAEKTFSGEGLSPSGLRPIIEERLRELRDPAGEIGRAEPFVAEICARLEDLPLDIQTGKDSRAAETIRLFSGVAEKIFRVCGILQAEGFPAGNSTVAGMPLTEAVHAFGDILQELLAAYERRDAVLVGDLAEYELAPRLRDLYAAMKTTPPAAAEE